MKSSLLLTVFSLFWPSIALAKSVIDSAIGGLIVGVTVSIAAFIFIWIVKILVSASRKITTKTKKGIKKGKQAIITIAKSEETKVLDIDDHYYEIAAEEISTNTQNQGLWIKSFTLAKGNEKKQKARYILLRAKGLYQEDLDRPKSHKIDRPKSHKIRHRNKPEKSLNRGSAIAIIVILVFLIYGIIGLEYEKPQKTSPAAPSEIAESNLDGFTVAPIQTTVVSEQELPARADAANRQNWNGDESNEEFFLLVSSFKQSGLALALSDRLALIGFSANVQSFIQDSEQWYMVEIGPIKGEETVIEIKQSLDNFGIEAVRVINRQ